jgi:hypothetical protein
MTDAASLAPEPSALMTALAREGGIRVDTLDEGGAPALRTLLQADGNIVVFVREDCLANEHAVDRHFRELERQMGTLLDLAHQIERRLARLTWIIGRLYVGSALATLGSTLASLLSHKVLFAEIAISLVPGLLAWGLRRLPSGWIARRGRAIFIGD